MVTFLHLSDIHFRRWSGDHYDLDDALRQQLLIDIDRVGKDLASPDAIFVSGDIAFSGSSDEYESARGWLGEICTRLGRTFSHVFCVPGNHDVDQTEIKDASLLSLVHSELRNAAPEELDAVITKHMRDKSAPDVIYRPITEYNKFAALFRCTISPKKPFWQADFVMEDTSTLRVWGLNSSLGSDHEDNEYKIVPLGEHQIPAYVPGVENLAVCHHPPDWWQDGDKTKQGFVASTRISLFGHKHSQILKTENGSLLVTAGAVHPDRRERDWRPRYNWLTVNLQNDDGRRWLKVSVHPRLWNDDRRFDADFNLCGGQKERTYRLPLESWEPRTTSEGASPPVAVSGWSLATDPIEVISPGGHMNPIRVLTYRFFELPHLVRRDIARKLDLLRDSDEGLQDFELFEQLYNRSRDVNQLADFWETVQSQHGDGEYADNPYRPTGS